MQRVSQVLRKAVARSAFASFLFYVPCSLSWYSCPLLETFEFTFSDLLVFRIDFRKFSPVNVASGCLSDLNVILRYAFGFNSFLSQCSAPPVPRTVYMVRVETAIF